MNTYSSRLQSQMKSDGDLTSTDPDKLMPDMADRAAWTIAQSNALARVKAYASMAKTINDQQ